MTYPGTKFAPGASWEKIFDLKGSGNTGFYNEIIVTSSSETYIGCMFAHKAQ